MKHDELISKFIQDCDLLRKIDSYHSQHGFERSHDTNRIGIGGGLELPIEDDNQHLHIDYDEIVSNIVTTFNNLLPQQPLVNYGQSYWQNLKISIKTGYEKNHELDLYMHTVDYLLTGDFCIYGMDTTNILKEWGNLIP